MPRYDQMRYLSTHNSYSGDISGKRKSLNVQLDAGVRCIEFDFHDDGYDDQRVHDYRVGHGGPGEEVDHSPENPALELRLTAWLKVLTKWSAEHTGHAPITIVLDAKDPLTDNPDGGDPADLNATLEAVFKTQLFRREHHTGTWPDWTDLKNKFLCVLSGNIKNRKCYRWDFGNAPALGVNTAGRIVVAFAEDSGDLSCWSGTADAVDETITWGRRYTYANSNQALFEPAVAVSDEGWVVCLHRLVAPQIPNGLWYRLGRLAPAGRIDWFKEDSYAVGANPTLKVEGRDITEIHTQSDTGARLKMVGTIDASKKRIVWKSPQKTQQMPYPTDRVKWQGVTLKCGTHRTDKWIGCRFDGSPLFPARFDQLAFVEVQSESELDTLLDPLFFAVPGDSSEKIGKARRGGYVVRGWAFSKGNAQHPADPKENFAATDKPFERWYDSYMQPRDGTVVGGIAE